LKYGDYPVSMLAPPPASSLKPPLSPKDLTEVLVRVYPPPCDRVGLSESALMRMAFHLIIEYHTLCRLACFRQLRACHFELVGKDISITFPSAKNDQLHMSWFSCLVTSESDFCPVWIMKLFFQHFGLCCGTTAADSSFGNFRIQWEASCVLPIRDKSLSASQATADLRSLLAVAGVTCGCHGQERQDVRHYSGLRGRHIFRRHDAHWQVTDTPHSTPLQA
jgi:hypothetical protein